MNELTAEEFERWWKETGEHELRQILLWRWDPIGVAHYFPNTADEYDEYAPEIVELLRRGATAAEIEEHLIEVERVQMDMSRPRDETGLAVLLVDWYDFSQDSWRKFGPLRR